LQAEQIIFELEKIEKVQAEHFSKSKVPLWQLLQL